MCIKPILFNTEMVRAILDGHKRVTRRVVTPQHLRVLNSQYHREHPETPDKALLEKLCQPPYSPGDVLWVRETWCKTDGHYLYRAFPGIGMEPEKQDAAMRKMGLKWRPSIHMPRRAARIWLRVTGVRVERLHDIDGLDAFDEGAVAPMPLGCLPPEKPDGYDTWSEEKRNDWIHSMARAIYMSKLEFQDRLIKAFHAIWDRTIKPADLETYGWAANPWVWVIKFERCEKPEEWPDA